MPLGAIELGDRISGGCVVLPVDRARVVSQIRQGLFELEHVGPIHPGSEVAKRRDLAHEEEHGAAGHPGDNITVGQFGPRLRCCGHDAGVGFESRRCQRHRLWGAEPSRPAGDDVGGQFPHLCRDEDR